MTAGDGDAIEAQDISGPPRRGSPTEGIKSIYALHPPGHISLAFLWLILSRDQMSIPHLLRRVEDKNAFLSFGNIQGDMRNCVRSYFRLDTKYRRNSLHPVCKLNIIIFQLSAICMTFLSSCSPYKEPKEGPIATLTCKQPPFASIGAIASHPVTSILAIDGVQLSKGFLSAQQSVKVAAGPRVLLVSAYGGPTSSKTSFTMNFKDGENYSIRTLADPLGHRYEIKDSQGKIIVNTNPVVRMYNPAPAMIFLPSS